MQAASLKKYEGQVIVLDLISGREITTRVKAVNVDTGVVVCSKPRVFVPMPNPHNPNDIQVICHKYGAPMYEADEEIEVDAGHVFTVFKPTEQHVSEYGRQTSGLVQAGAGVMDQLKDIDMSKIIGQ